MIPTPVLKAQEYISSLGISNAGAKGSSYESQATLFRVEKRGKATDPRVSTAWPGVAFSTYSGPAGISEALRETMLLCVHGWESQPESSFHPRNITEGSLHRHCTEWAVQIEQMVQAHKC